MERTTRKARVGVVVGMAVCGVALVATCVMSSLAYLEIRRLVATAGSQHHAVGPETAEGGSQVRRMWRLAELKLQRDAAAARVEKASYPPIVDMVRPEYSIERKRYLDLPHVDEERLRQTLDNWSGLSEAEQQQALQDFGLEEPLAQSREEAGRRIDALLASPAYAEARERAERTAREAVEAFAERVREQLHTEGVAPEVK